MKKITLIVFMFLASWSGYSQLALEDFEDNGNALPTGWQQLNVAGAAQSWTVATHSVITPAYEDVGHAAYIQRENMPPGNTSEDWLVTPQFNVPVNGQLRFQSRLTQLGDDLSTYRIMMHIGNDPTNTAAYTQVQSWTELALNPDPFQQAYLEKVVAIPAAAVGQMVYIAFVMNGDNGDRWLVDNVMAVSQCLDPVGQPTTLIGTDTATLNWTNPSGATEWDIDIVLTVEAPTGVGFSYSGLPPYTATTNSAGAPLTPATQYKYYVRADCGSGATSNWAGPYYFTTVVPGTNCTSAIEIPTNTFSQTSNTNLYGDDIEGTVGAAAGCSTAAAYLNGDEVVYAYTPTYTGNAGFAMTNNGANSGMFIYTSCASIGVTCTAGGTGNATTPVNLTLPVTAGTTYYVVISTSGTTQSTPYTLTIQQVNCTPPVGQLTTGVGPNSANLSWTNPSGATAWEVVTQPSGTGIPAGAGAPAGTNTNFTVTGLAEATNYEYYVRADCGDGTWSSWAGPYFFSTTQTPAPMNYAQNFDGATHGWALNNGTQTNKWVVGTATFNSPGKSLYISNDNGVSNNFTNNSASTVQAYRDIQLPAAVDQVSLSFDWKSGGESTWDYMRVWVVPATFTPTPGTQITAANSGGVQIGGNLNLQTAWQSANFTLNAGPFANSVRRLVFEWRNDGSGGVNPGGAIDNINLSLITCPSPTALVIGTVSDTSVTFNWTGPTSVTPTYDYYFGTSPTAPTAGSTPTGNVAANTVTITPLTPSTTYYFWVRSNCGGANGNSFWVGPASFTTTQIPAPMPFAENFDGVMNWTLVNGTQTNKWFVGPATFNSPANSLYITNDNGATHAFTNNATTTVQAYRDIQMPAAVDQLNLSFDWKALAETCCDYVRVWVVPTTFTPTAGTLITAANSGGVQIGGNHNGQADWQTANYVVNGTGWGGTTRRLVFEWRNDFSGGDNPPGAIDNVNLQVITCPAPTALVLGTLTENSATINWTGPTSVTPTFDYVFGTSPTAPVAGTVPTGNVTPATITLGSLTPSTTYYYWVRSNCGGGDTSTWTGPLSFTTPQIPGPMPYVDGFDGTINWTLVNGTQTNKWFVGPATFTSPANSLYITNDNGATHAFTNNAATTVQAYRDIQMPAAVDQLTLSFDWKALAENCCDYVRVWIVPATFTPTAGTLITAGAGRVQVGGNHNGQADWQTANYTINGAGWGGTIRRLVFEWRNDTSLGNNPPGAIDNVNFQVLTCPAPTALVLSNPGANSFTMSWTGPTSVTPTFDYYLTTTSTPPVAGTVPTGNVSAPTVNLTGLESSTTYYFWVRSNCGAGDTSVWVGPISYNTPQIPAPLDYVQDFEDVNPMWTLSNGTQTNKWVVGTATFNSPTHSLYISNDNGVTNAFTNNSLSVVHAYRDLTIPVGTTEVDLSFDWKGVGESCCDYLRVWMVPVTFSPVAGTQITAAADRMQLGGNMNMQANWVNQSFTFDASAYANTNRRLVFEWRNDGSLGTNPPAAVDNIDISVILCPKPTNIQVLGVTATQATFTWTPVGPATAWEVYIVPAGSPAPNSATVGLPASAPTLTVSTGLIPGTEYVVYVRSVCGGANGNSKWAGPVPFVTEPLCPEPDNLTVDCISSTGANFTWEAGGTETSWEYALLPASSPFPTSGTLTTTPAYVATGLTVATDYVFYVRAICPDEENGYSTWAQVDFTTPETSVVDAEPFCGSTGDASIIFDNVYDDLNVQEYGQVACLGSTPNPVWYYLQVEDAGQLDFQMIQNTAFDEDGNPIGQGLDVDFSVWGPFDNLTQACAQIDLIDCPTCPFSNVGSTFYPFGNIIDCSYSASATETMTIPDAQEGEIYAVLITNFNGDQGQIQLQQLDSSEGSTNCDILYNVDLGADQVLCGVENTTITATVTTPGNSQTPTYEWFMDDSTTPFTPTVVSTTPLTQTIQITEPGYHTYTVVVSVENAANNEPITDEVIVALGPEVNVADPAEVVLCGEAGSTTIDLTTLDSAILGTLLPADYLVTYYESEADAENGINAIDTTLPYTTSTQVIWVRVSSVAVDTCFDVVPLTITVNETADAAITYADSPFCTNGGTAAVTQTGDTGGTYSSTAGLTIDTATGAITLATSTAGTYTVTYTIAATPSCPEFNTTAEVVVEAAPEATIAYAGTPYCSDGGTATVTQTGNTGGVYSSTTGLVIDAATGAIDLAASTAGTYTVTYTVAATAACDALAVTTEVTVNTLPVATIAYDALPYCSDGGTATVTQTGNAGGVYSSTAGLTIDAATGAITLASSTAGTYTVTYTIAAGSGCPAVTATATVTVTALPSAIFTYEVAAVCQNAGGTEAPTFDTGAVAGTFTTDVAGLTIDPATGVITPSTSTAGTYIVTNTIAAANGCGEVTSSVTITINLAPVATFSYDAAAYCQDSSNPSPILVGGAGTFSSTEGLVINSTTGVIDLAASQPGTYTVTNTIPGTVDCPTVTATTTVTITSIPVIAVLQGCEGSAYMLEVTFDDDEIYTVDNVDFVWTNSAGVEVGSTATIQVTVADTYYLTVIPMDNTECSMEAVVVVADTTCEIPRGISPNGDDKNQNFDLTALDVKKLSIFNRYGQEVYTHGNGYTNQWEGQTSGGDELPTGTYFYMIERANGESKTGWVYINRQE